MNKRLFYYILLLSISNLAFGYGDNVSIKAMSNGKFLSATSFGNGDIWANATTRSDWERFERVDLGGGVWAIRSTMNVKYVQAIGGGGGMLRANSTLTDTWEKVDAFQVPGTSDQWWLRQHSNNKYWMANPYDDSVTVAGAAPGEWEKFQIEPFGKNGWQQDFFDGFDGSSLDMTKWVDQLLWVNNEDQCYPGGGQYGTRQVSNGSLKINLIKLDNEIDCNNWSKTGEKHPNTRYVAGRIATKNRFEAPHGKWTARIRLSTSNPAVSNGRPGMFPAYWVLGYANNEPPIEHASQEVVCWPLVGSGEIDIMEHHGSSGADHFAARPIFPSGPNCDDGDWWSGQTTISTSLGNYHEYSLEWYYNHIRILVDGTERAIWLDAAPTFPEPFFAILNYAKITNDPMDESSWTMEVDWIKHETWR